MNQENMSSMKKAVCETLGITPDSSDSGLSRIIDIAVREISGLHDLGFWNTVAFDGPADPGITTEDDKSLSFCGLFWTLSGAAPWKVPLRVVFERENHAINYQLWIGNRDGQWNALSQSKQWERIYLMCRGQYSPRWEWSVHVAGKLGVS